MDCARQTELSRPKAGSHPESSRLRSGPGGNGGSLKRLRVKFNATTLSRFCEPVIQLLVNALAGQCFPDFVAEIILACVLVRAGAPFHFPQFAFEIRANVVIADLNTWAEPNIDEVQQRELPEEMCLQIFFGDAVF